MSFDFVRLLDQILGRMALYILAPFCIVLEWVLKPIAPRDRKHVAFLKLHGGGSLLVAMPALLGLRQKYPTARFDLVCTKETKKYAELTGVFDRFITINSASLPGLVASGFEAISHCWRNDAFIDLEPHSFLAAVFTLLTLSRRRTGLIKPHQNYRALAYTDALYFNPHAPIYIFYEQIARSMGAEPIDISQCQSIIRTLIETIQPMDQQIHTRPAILIGAFASRHGQERMMPPEVWATQLEYIYGDTPITLVLSGGFPDKPLADVLEKKLRSALPNATVLNKCGQCTLIQTARDIQSMDAFWGIDSGLLHLARLLSKNVKSFWGPTNPGHRLKPIPDLQEETVYQNFPCSPCIHVGLTTPCKGNNLCLKSLAYTTPAVPPAWYVRRKR